MATNSENATINFTVPANNKGCETIDGICLNNNQQSNDIFNVKNRPVGQLIVSVIVMIVVASSWALSTQFTKTALIINRKYFYAPYFLVWFNTNFMITCYPIYILYMELFGCLSLKELHKEALLVYGRENQRLRSYFFRTFIFLTFWLAANYSYSQSLGHISASASSAIMSCNTAMVCILGWFILHDRFIPFWLISIATSIAGVIVISMEKEFAGSFLGVCLCINSALSAALYKVLFKKIIGDATIGQVSLFMSGLGLLNACFNFIPMAILLITQTETFILSEVPWPPLIGVAFLSLLFNFCINFGIALLHPLVISVGMLFGIPISAAVDIIFRNMHATPRFIVGAILILISCAIIALPPKFCNIKKKRTANMKGEVCNI